MRTVEVPTRLNSSMYHMDDDIFDINVGDNIIIKFENSGKVKKKYRDKELKFYVNNIKKYEWWDIPGKGLALVPYEFKCNFKESDILIIHPTMIFEHILDGLFPCNRIPFRGWMNKEVTFIKKEL